MFRSGVTLFIVGVSALLLSAKRPHPPYLGNIVHLEKVSSWSTRNMKEPKLYFQNVAGQLLEDPAGFLRANWFSQPRQFDDTRALFPQMLQALQYHNWSRILVNQVGMKPFTLEEQNWVAKEWLTRAVREGGYRYGAVVVSHEVMVRLATAYITTHVQGLPLVYRSFEADADAVKWLLQQSGSARQTVKA